MRNSAPQTTRLLVCARGQFSAADAVRKAGIVLDPRTRTGLAAGRVPLAHQRTKPLRRRIHSGRKTRRPGADDNHVVELTAGRRRQTRTRGQLGAPVSRGQIPLARDALRPARDRLGVFLEALEPRAVGKQNERQAAGAQGVDLEQTSERIPVEVKPAMSNVVPPQEVQGGIDARAAAPTENRGPNSVHPPLSNRLS